MLQVRVSARDVHYERVYEGKYLLKLAYRHLYNIALNLFSHFCLRHQRVVNVVSTDGMRFLDLLPFL